MDDNDRKRRPSRWGDQASNNFRPNGPQGPNAGPFNSGPGVGPMGGPMMGPGGPRGGGKGLLGQGPSLLGAPKSLMSLPVNPPASLMAANNSSQPAFPPGYGEGGFNEEQVKTFLKTQRDALQVTPKSFIDIFVNISHRSRYSALSTKPDNEFGGSHYSC